MKYNAEKIIREMAVIKNEARCSTLIPYTEFGFDSLEIMRLSKKLKAYNSPEGDLLSYHHRNYDEITINRILEERKEYGLTISEVSSLYGISRNTVSKWVRGYTATKKEH
jgi:hypothetical protein